MNFLSKISLRKLVNRAVSARVDAQMEWRMEGVRESIEALQRVHVEMSTSIADRLTAIEAAMLNPRDSTDS